MSALALLVPLAVAMGLAGLAAFLWSLRAGQYDDPDGAALRILAPDAADRPLRTPGPESTGEDAREVAPRPRDGRA